ncbi:ABC transporter permease [Mangrovicella endophytica]|uniref:ABC transporter permease n=1 Tax=Mangrovicella endophytica TaxID=2066697 RepID=UPI000C9DF9BF|nr:ABC transporter permease [Mangrovicella endophytica]
MALTDVQAGRRQAGATLRPRLAGSLRLLGGTGTAFLVVIAAWQAAVLILRPPPFMLPSPLRVAETLVARWPMFLSESAVTGIEVLAGLVFGIAAGILSGLLVVALPRLGRLVWPLLLVLQAMPVFALAPLLVLWFGFGLTSKVAMAGLIIFFPVASAFADGLRRIDPDLIDATAMTEASHWQALRHVRVPLALPSLGTGIRVAAPFAPLGAVIGEWVGASGGLGFVMLQANARMQTDTVFAAIAILAAATLFLRFLADALCRRLAPWAPETA